MSTGRNWPGGSPALTVRLVLAAILLVTLILFLLGCLVMDHHGGAHRSWEVLIGVRTPVGQASGLAVALSILGFVVVPAAIGLLAADVATRFMRKRMIPTSEAEARILERFDAALVAETQRVEQREKERLEQAQAAAATAPAQS